jgi:hypothetical protein
MNPPSQAFRRIQSWLSHKLVGYDLEFYLYLVFAGFCTLYAAKTFFDVRALHLGWAEAARMSSSPNAAVAELAPIRWSAPLDDTFIHFDFARSFARLRPFEWAPGGGAGSIHSYCLLESCSASTGNVWASFLTCLRALRSLVFSTVPDACFPRCPDSIATLSPRPSSSVAFSVGPSGAEWNLDYSSRYGAVVRTISCWF